MKYSPFLFVTFLMTSLVVLLNNAIVTQAQGGRTIERNLGFVDPSHTAFIMGFNKLNQGDYEKAIWWFTQAIDHRPEWASPYAGRALSHYLLENYANALNDYTYAVFLSPEYISAYNGRARVFLTMGEYDLALSDTATARGLDPAYPEPYWTEGDVYFAQGAYEKALVSYKRYLVLAGEDASEDVVSQVIACRSYIAANSMTMAALPLSALVLIMQLVVTAARFLFPPGPRRTSTGTTA